MLLLGIMLTLVGPAMTIAEDYSNPMRDLATFADTSGSQYVHELRCETGREWFIRGEVRQFVSKYLKPERVAQFMEITFDRRVGHSVIHDPCDKESLDNYRRWAKNQKTEALASLKANGIAER